MPSLADLLALLRPRHWAKGVFVFMPVPFALAAAHATLRPLAFLAGLVAISLASSAAYAFNDAADAAQDREHPVKRSRPVASGRVSPAAARAWSALLSVAALGAAGAGAGARPAAIVAIYLLLNLLYTLGAKNVPLVDVFLLSSGFVLRVLLGCALIAVTPSSWLLLCSSTLSLFLALAKRKADLAMGLGPEHRPSLAGYRPAFVEQAMAISAAMTIIAYGLYSMEAEVMVRGREFATLPFVVFGVLDYLRISHVRPERASPVDLVLSSPVLLACGAGWAAAAVWSLGLV